MGNGIQVRSRIPTFSSIEEGAEFWDTHDTTEFEDEWEPVELDVARPLVHGLSIRLDATVFHRLVAIAKKRGVPVSNLAATLIADGLARDDDAGQADLDQERSTS